MITVTITTYVGALIFTNKEQDQQDNIKLCDVGGTINVWLLSTNNKYQNVKEPSDG